MSEIPPAAITAAAAAIERELMSGRDYSMAADSDDALARAALEAAAPLLAEAWGVVIRAEADDGNGPAEVEIIYLESWRSEAWDDTVPSRPGWQVKVQLAEWLEPKDRPSMSPRPAERQVQVELGVRWDLGPHAGITSARGPLRSPQWRHDWAYQTRGVAQMVATRHLRSKHAGGAR